MEQPPSKRAGRRFESCRGYWPRCPAPARPVTKVLRIPASPCQRSVLARNGASRIPGAVQRARAPWTKVVPWADENPIVRPMILPKERDPRFITVRRGGTLEDSDHRLLALWAAACAEHVLKLFESVQPSDPRPREAIEQTRAWARGQIRMSQSRAAGGHAMAAARELRGAARHAAYAAGQAAVVAHVAAHELGAAAYAIKAVRAVTPGREGESAGRLECRWQREQLPDAIRELVLDDQRLRNEICWSVFDC